MNLLLLSSSISVSINLKIKYRMDNTGRPVFLNDMLRHSACLVSYQNIISRTFDAFLYTFASFIYSNSSIIFCCIHLNVFIFWNNCKHVKLLTWCIHISILCIPLWKVVVLRVRAPENVFPIGLNQWMEESEIYIIIYGGEIYFIIPKSKWVLYHSF